MYEETSNEQLSETVHQTARYDNAATQINEIRIVKEAFWPSGFGMVSQFKPLIGYIIKWRDSFRYSSIFYKVVCLFGFFLFPNLSRI